MGNPQYSLFETTIWVSYTTILSTTTTSLARSLQLNTLVMPCISTSTLQFNSTQHHTYHSEGKYVVALMNSGVDQKSVLLFGVNDHMNVTGIPGFTYR